MELGRKLGRAQSGESTALIERSVESRSLESLTAGASGVAGSPQIGMTPKPWLPLFGLQVPLPAAMSALRHRNFRLFWSGQLVSLVGTWMQAVARGWLVLELTHSPFWLGMVAFANSLPVLLFSLWAGALADNVSKRTLIIWTQTISMVMAFVLAALTLSGTVQVWHILAVSLVLGTVFAFDAPTRQAFTVEMVGKEDLMNAVALNSSIFNGARVLGPSIGAIILTWQGPGLAFLFNGISYLAVIAGLFMMDMPAVVKKMKARSGKQILEGLNYVRKDTVIGPLMLIVVMVSLFAFPYATLMPIFADSVLHVGKEGYGTLMAVTGVGSLVGAVTLAFQSGRQSIRRGRIIVLGSLGLPIFLSVFSLSGSYLLSLAMLAGIGYTMISINATVNTVVQTNVPDELRGRVSGVFAFLFIGMAPLGNLQAGLVADHFGAQTALFIGSIMCGVSTVAILLRFRHITELL